jgi:type III secretion protein J
MKRRRAAPLVLAGLLTSCLRHELQSGLSEHESQEVIVLLEEHGLRGIRKPEAAKGQEKGEPNWAVFVQGGGQELVQAWRVMHENGLPRERVKGFDQVYTNSGLIPTPGEEKARLLSALSGELSRTLRSLAGVADARVHVVIPENSPLIDRAQWSPTTASVLIKHVSRQPPLKEEEIKSLVSRGVEGLQPDNVAVVFQKVAPKPPPARDIRWLLGNELILVASLGTAVIASLGLLMLIAKSRWQRRQMTQLRQKLEAAERQPA